jgi:hypothetical protein
MIFYNNMCFWYPFITFNYVEICFDDGLWVFKYVYEIKKWNVYYELYDELKSLWCVEKIMMRMWC